MNQTQQNLMRLTALCRNVKNEFRACFELAKKLNLPNPRKAKPQSAANMWLQNFVRGIHPADLQTAVAKLGSAAVFNKVNTDSILATAARKFAAMGGR